MDAPWFFVSHASLPPPGDDMDTGLPMAGKNVREFYRDLFQAVAAMHGDRPSADAGYLDAIERGGATATRALQRCHAFVPLMSRRYFADPYCGRQWYAFTRRSSRGTLVPVLWTPVPTSVLPVRVDLGLPVPEPPTAPLHVDEEALYRYSREGLYGLRQDPGRWDHYDQCVRRIAQCVIQAVRRAPEPPSSHAESADLHDVPDAFAAPARPALGVVVLAPDIHHLPPGRRDTAYGLRPRDWRPYSDCHGVPFAERIAGLARNLGFAPEIHTYDTAEPEFLGHRETSCPWVLVLDPWILRDPTARHRLRQFDSRDLPWVTVLTAIPDDPQTRHAGEELTELLRSALPRRLSSSRALQRGAILGVAGSEAFSSRFQELADSAAQQYVNRVPLRSTTTQSPASTERSHAGDQEAQQ